MYVAHHQAQLFHQVDRHHHQAVYIVKELPVNKLEVHVHAAAHHQYILVLLISDHPHHHHQAIISIFQS